MRAKFISLICILCTLSVVAQEKAETTTPACSSVNGSTNLFTSIEFLYWKAIQEGLSYSNTGVSFNGQSQVKPGTVHRPDFPWQPGVRVGLGYHLPHDDWDLFANYTYLHSSSSDHAKSRGGNMAPIGFSSLGFGDVGVKAATSASNRWSLDFSSVDLELGKAFCISNYLKFRLFSGLKFTWQDQEILNRYVANQITIGNTTEHGTARMHLNQDVWGVGIRFGGNGNWYFYRSWSIATKMSISGVCLDYKSKRNDKFQQSGSPGLVINHLRKDGNTLKAVMELFLGLHNEWWLKKNRYHLAVQGGFDEQIWLNFGQFLISSSQGNGNFTMSGFNFKARLDF